MKYASTISFFIIVAGILGAIYVYASRPAKGDLPQEVLVPFAQCLATNELTMYGAEWCPHCKNEKARFGEAFKYVPYVECPDNEKLCIDKGIQGYPTWIDKNGVKYAGEQGLKKLSEISGCPLPESDSLSK